MGSRRRPWMSEMAKPTSDGRKVRGASLATKLTFFIGGSVILFMLVFSVFLRSFVRDGMTESLKVTAYEAARAAAHSDVEAWGRFFGTPYQGWTRAEIEAKTTSYRNKAELEQAFLTPLQKAIRDRNDERLTRVTEGDTIIVAAEFFYDDPQGELDRGGRLQFLKASYTGEMVYRGGLGTRREFERGAAEQGLLTIDDGHYSVIRGVHAMEDDEGNEDDETNLLRIDHTVEELQRKRLEAVKQERDSAAVETALAAIRTAAEDPSVNLMPPIIDAVKAYATEEEISGAMRDVFGTYVEQAIV